MNHECHIKAHTKQRRDLDVYIISSVSIVYAITKGALRIFQTDIFAHYAQTILSFFCFFDSLNDSTVRCPKIIFAL